MRIGIVGATGAVGHELLRLLEQVDWPIDELKLYASPRNVGKTLTFHEKDVSLEGLSDGPLAVDLVFASAGSAVSKRLAPHWSAGGAVVIDNSSAFRLEQNIPLVIPEVNSHTLDRDWSRGGIIANPNCTTAIAAVAVWPLHKAFGVRRMIVSTYQATSGAGSKGMIELETQTRRALTNEVLPDQMGSGDIFPHPIAFNLIPHIDVFQNNGYTKEEIKVVFETRKIFEEPDLPISCTAVRIPTFRAHAEAITLELARTASPEAARSILDQAPGVQVVDDPSSNRYPMPVTASQKMAVEVGRIRKSLVFEQGLELFVCGDQLLKGAALNAIQIAQALIEKGLLNKS